MSLDNVLADLQVKYIQNIPQKLQVIKEHIEGKDFKGLREDFHKIKGTGKTYGVPEISDLGSLFEEILILCEFDPHPEWALDAHNLLKDIYAHRSESKVYTIQSDSRFQSLQNILKSLKE